MVTKSDEAVQKEAESDRHLCDCASMQILDNPYKHDAPICNCQSQEQVASNSEVLLHKKKNQINMSYKQNTEETTTHILPSKSNEPKINVNNITANNFFVTPERRDSKKPTRRRLMQLRDFN